MHVFVPIFALFLPIAIFFIILSLFDKYAEEAGNAFDVFIGIAIIVAITLSEIKIVFTYDSRATAFISGCAVMFCVGAMILLITYVEEGYEAAKLYIKTGQTHRPFGGKI